MARIVMKSVIDDINKNLAELDNTRITNAYEFHADIRKRTAAVLSSAGVNEFEYGTWELRTHRGNLSYEMGKVAPLEFNFTRDKNSKWDLRGRLHSVRYVLEEKYNDLTVVEWFKAKEREQLAEKIYNLEKLIEKTEDNLLTYRREKTGLEAMLGF